MGFAFDPFSFQQSGLPASEVSISRDQIVDALMIAQMVVDHDEGVDFPACPLNVRCWEKREARCSA
jgi:hypothetical protein